MTVFANDGDLALIFNFGVLRRSEIDFEANLVVLQKEADPAPPPAQNAQTLPR